MSSDWRMDSRLLTIHLRPHPGTAWKSVTFPRHSDCKVCKNNEMFITTVTAQTSCHIISLKQKCCTNKIINKQHFPYCLFCNVKGLDIASLKIQISCDRFSSSWTRFIYMWIPRCTTSHADLHFC
jgi:hypothetical protein